MCKLFCITGRLPKKVTEDALAFINEEFRDQRDGFGFVVKGLAQKRPAYGRYLYPDRYAGFGVGLPRFLQGTCTERGQMPEISTAIVAHGRTSTNNVTMHNVHPFLRDGLYLAHNGILHWSGPAASKPDSKGGCDSEMFLNWLLAGGKWDETHNYWSGYGAMLLYNSLTDQVVVASDGTASLYVSKRKLGGWVFSTRDDDLLKVCRCAGIQLATRPIKCPQVLVALDAATGEFVSDVTWKGFGSSYYQGDDYYRSKCGGSGYTVYTSDGQKFTRTGREEESDWPASAVTAATQPKLDLSPAKEVTPHENKVPGFKPEVYTSSGILSAAEAAAAKAAKEREEADNDTVELNWYDPLALGKEPTADLEEELDNAMEIQLDALSQSDRDGLEDYIACLELELEQRKREDAASGAGRFPDYEGHSHASPPVNTTNLPDGLPS